MGIFRSQQVIASAAQPASLADRYSMASAMHGSALSVFQDIADRLSAAESEYLSIVAEADDEIERLTVLRDQANSDAQRARISVVSIFDLTRGMQE